ncbi:MAG TPA: hypothetical protein VK085_10670 [Pseudogracilibacillus sp.]|nr:hypothetical protein [Pseudogracilibacillus sp.]
MIQATLTIGIVLTVALLILSLILVKVTSKKSYATYVPGLIFFAAGLILLLFATIIDRIWIMGAGLGGWGIACLFAAGISLMITAIFDAYRQETA